MTVLKKILILIILFLFISCRNKQKSIKYYPSRKIFETSNVLVINAKGLLFSEIIKNAENAYMKQTKPYLVLNINKTERHIILHIKNEGLVKGRNILLLDKDSIYKENNFSLVELNRIMKKHYFNNNKSIQYSENQEKAVIELYLNKDESYDTVKALIDKIIIEFDTINKESKKPLQLFLIVSSKPSKTDYTPPKP